MADLGTRSVKEPRCARVDAKDFYSKKLSVPMLVQQKSGYFIGGGRQQLLLADVLASTNNRESEETEK